MQNITWENYLEESKLNLKNANHLAYVTIVLLKEKRLLVKILMDLHKSAVSIIKAYLHYEASFGRVRITSDPIKNLNIFLVKIAPRYLKENEIESLLKILKTTRQHKDAPLEFVRREKLVIFNDGKYEFLTSEIIKDLSSKLGRIISSFPVSK